MHHRCVSLLYVCGARKSQGKWYELWLFRVARPWWKNCVQEQGHTKIEINTNALLWTGPKYCDICPLYIPINVTYEPNPNNKPKNAYNEWTWQHFKHALCCNITALVAVTLLLSKIVNTKHARCQNFTMNNMLSIIAISEVSCVPYTRRTIIWGIRSHI